MFLTGTPAPGGVALHGPVGTDRDASSAAPMLLTELKRAAVPCCTGSLGLTAMLHQEPACS